MDTISIVGRIKEGFNIWRKGWLSFILAVILLFFAFAIFMVPIMAIADYFGVINETVPTFLGAIRVIALTGSSIVFIFVVIGPMYGLGKELIEIEDTRAENILHYIKNYGLKFAVIGLIIATVIFGPLTAIRLLLNTLNTGRGPAFGIFAFIVAFFLLAPFTLSIPAALIDDMGPIESIRASIHLFRKDPRTVLLLFGFFFGIFLALFSPAIFFVFALLISPTIELHVIPAVVAFFGSIFLLFPVMCITFTKFYYDYSPQKKEVSEEESPIRLF